MKRYIGVIFITISIAITATLTVNKKGPAQVEERDELMSVVTHEMGLRTVDDVVVGNGVARPRWETTLASEVSGRVLQVTPTLLTGAMFKKGDLMAVIDATAYQSQLASAKLSLAEAKRKLEEEKQRAIIAAQNWEESGFPGKPSDLVLHKPQLHEAEENIAYAKSQVDKAAYDLAQTKIFAPYNGAVLERNINPGDSAQPGDQIARIYDRSVIEVPIPLNSKEIARLNNNIVGQEVVLRNQDGSETWKGRVARLEQQIDKKNLWQNVIIEILHPSGLLPGAFVTAELPGKKYKGLLVLPEHFQGEDGSIWFVDESSTLQKFKAERLIRNKGKIFIEPPKELSLPVNITTGRDIYLSGVKVKPIVSRKGHVVSINYNK